MKTIEELATEAGMHPAPDEFALPDWWEVTTRELTKFAKLVRAESAQEIAALQARLDRLMLEHCPDEMTPEQIATWRTHQRVAAARPVIQLPISTLGLDDQGCERN